MINTSLNQLSIQKNLKTDNKTSLKNNQTLSQNLKQNLKPSDEEQVNKAIQNQSDIKLKELLNKLLDQINTQKNPNSPLLQEGIKLNLAPNFANELKILSTELAKDDIFTQVLDKLNSILKPISEIKNNKLDFLFNNSGVFLEAKLKEALNEELLPKSFFLLLSSIKGLSNKKVSEQILQLANANLSPKNTLKELKNIISSNKNENKQILDKSSFNILLKLASKLENFKNYISKNPSHAQEKLSFIADKILKELNALKDDFSKALTKVQLKDTQVLKQSTQAFEKLENTLKNISKEHFQTNPTSEQNSLKNQAFKSMIKNLAFDAQNLDLEQVQDLSKNINNLAQKLNQSLKELEPQTQDARLNQAELRTLEYKLDSCIKDLTKIKLKSKQDIIESLHLDVKSTLLQISNLAQSQANEAIYNQSNRLLAQLQINQLMSLANEGINTYLPFFWEDLKDSKIMFRRGKKDKFFTQIELEFARFEKVEILIALNNEKYIDINIMVQNAKLRKLIYQNAHELKKNIHKAGLLSANFFIGDIIKTKLNTKNTQNLDLKMGIDKKA